MTSQPIPTTSQPMSTILHRSSESNYHHTEKLGRIPLSSSPSRFAISMQSLSGTDVRRWFHQFHQGHMVNYLKRMYRYLQAVKHHRREEQARRRGEMAARAGLRLDEVPYPALWLEWLVQNMGELPFPPGWGVGFWGMEWPDLVSWLSPSSWWAGFWKWYWTDSISWTWMAVFLTTGALLVRVWLGARVWTCLLVPSYTMVICYMGPIHAKLEVVCAYFMD